MSPIPQDGHVPIHSARDCQSQVFEVAVVGRRNDEASIFSQHLSGLSHKLPGVEQMLNDLDRDDKIKRRLQIVKGQVINTGLKELAIREMTLREPIPDSDWSTPTTR